MTMIFKHFAECRRGNIAAMIALSLVPLLGIIGLAIDSARGYSAKSHLIAAVDAAALAAAQASTPDEARHEALRFINANFGGDDIGAKINKVDVRWLENGKSVLVEVDVDLPTSFLQLLSYDQIPVTAKTIVARDRKRLEVALALDVSYSMVFNNLMQPMKTAARDMVDDLFDRSTGPDDVHMSVVPWSSRVRVGKRYDNWLSQQDDSFDQDSWTGCVEVRDGVAGVVDRPPNRRGKFEPHETWIDGLSKCPRNAVTPLSNNRLDLKREIDSLVASMATRTDIGMAWAWRTVSPRWQNRWYGLDRQRPSQDEDVVKTVVMFSDGQIFAQYSDITNKEAEDRYVEICDNMKEKGVQIFTITYGTYSEWHDLHVQCASSSEHYYNATDAKSLENAFHAISGQLSKLRITS